MAVEIIVGDCRGVLKSLPEKHFHTCVTSPPYFGLRDYDVDGQMGLEASPDLFVAELVGVFREVRRVLRDDGTVWLNLGDSYSGSWGAQGHKVTESDDPSWHSSQIKNHPKRQSRTGTIKQAGLKAKDLIGIPWMVAFALRADGWYLRQDIIWAKPNPMPESVGDRCTKAHEYLFLLSKSEKYHYDAEAIREARISDRPDMDENGLRTGVAYLNGNINNSEKPAKRRIPGNKRLKGQEAYEAGDERFRTHAGMVAYAERERAADQTDMGTRNKRSVWTVGSAPFKEAHFATFPPALIEPCILAGCPAGGNVLDPFGGAGTTGLVADRHGRNATLVELNPDYAAMAKARIERDSPLFSAVTIKRPLDLANGSQLDG